MSDFQLCCFGMAITTIAIGACWCLLIFCAIQFVFTFDVQFVVEVISCLAILKFAYDLPWKYAKELKRIRRESK